MKQFLKNNKRKIYFAAIVILFLAAAGYFWYARVYQMMPQATIWFLNDVQSAKKDEKVLIFSPHPDDETIAVGGYIYDSIKNGANVYIVLVTDGNKHHLEERRYEEFKKATSTLGVAEENLIFLNYPDGQLKLIDRAELKNKFLIEIEQISPTVIIYPHPQDSHPDHATTGSLIEEILKEKKLPVLSYQYLVHHRRFPQPKKLESELFLLPPVSMVRLDKEWQRLLLDEETETTKMEAVFCYKSQLKNPILRSLLLSLIRKNELFVINGND